MTKALLMAGSLVALTLAMQEVAAGQANADDPLGGLKGVRAKKMDERTAKKPAKAPAQLPAAAAAQPVDPEQGLGLPEAEDLEPLRSGIGLGALLPSGAVATSAQAGSPPAAPRPQAQQPSRPPSHQPSAQPSHQPSSHTSQPTAPTRPTAPTQPTVWSKIGL